VRRSVLLLSLLLLAARWSAAAEPQPPQWILVTTPTLRPAAEPLCEHRRAEGMDVHVVTVDEQLKSDEGNLGARIKSEIEHARGDRSSPTYVLLVGAATDAGTKDGTDAIVPMPGGTCGRMKGMPTDHAYGCCGEDLLPTVAVGRFPAQNLAEAQGMVDKTLAFEREANHGDWQNRLTVLVGNPGGANEFERRMAEAVGPGGMLLRFSQIDPAFTARFIIHANGSPYTVPDADLHERSLKYLRDGQFFACYLGHSAAPGFWSSFVRFLDRNDWSTVAIPNGPGIFFTCGCYACQVSGADGEGYALAAARNPKGPVAVIGSHGESYSVAGLLALDGLLGCWHGGKPPERLADYWMAVQTGLARGPVDSFTFFALDQVDGSHGKSSLDEQRREHLEMWTLMGDPALRMPTPAAPIQLESSAAVTPGKEISVSGALPPSINSATVRLTLERPLGSVPIGLASVPSDPQQAQAVIRANHERANNLVLDSQTIEVQNGRFTASLAVPADAPWPKVIVRAFADLHENTGRGTLSIPLGK
jgi:Peptidase family C25